MLFALEIDGAVATITLDRPHKRHVLRAADLTELERLLDRVEHDGAVRALAVTGTGQEVFCAGFDIGDIAATDWRERPLERALAALEALSVPTLCILNGGAYGGGADLALACDLRIGHEGVQVSVPAARLGAHYHLGGLRRFVQRLGPGAAKRLLLAGETMDAETLLRVGFLDYMVPREDLIDRARALLEDIAGFAPLSLAGMKSALDQIACGTLDREAVERTMLACMRSDDLAEGIAAFAEKRQPTFRGR